jgi:hypothetical protein
MCCTKEHYRVVWFAGLLSLGVWKLQGWSSIGSKVYLGMSCHGFFSPHYFFWPLHSWPPVFYIWLTPVSEWSCCTATTCCAPYLLSEKYFFLLLWLLFWKSWRGEYLGSDLTLARSIKVNKYSWSHYFGSYRMSLQKTFFHIYIIIFYFIVPYVLLICVLFVNITFKIYYCKHFIFMSSS